MKKNILLLTLCCFLSFSEAVFADTVWTWWTQNNGTAWTWWTQNNGTAWTWWTQNNGTAWTWTILVTVSEDLGPLLGVTCIGKWTSRQK